MSDEIKFTQIEAEVMMHRLELLYSDEEDILEELFCDDEEFNPARGAEYVQRVYLSWVNASSFCVPLDVPEAIKILAECLEGNTFFGDIKDAVRAKTISSVKAAQFRKAADTAATKIEAVLGRTLNVPFK